MTASKQGKRTYGDGSLFLRGVTWWVQFSAGGRVHRESSRSSSKIVARNLLRTRQSEVASGEFAPNARKLSFDELARFIETNYKTTGRRSWARAELSLRHLREHLGNLRAVEITADRIDLYVASRLSEDAALGSIQNELAALKRCFTLAIAKNRLHRRPAFPTLRVSNTRKEFFEPAELEAVIAQLPERWRPVIRFASISGWRARGEVVGMLWSQVDFVSGTVRLNPGTTKNSEGRSWPAASHPILAELIREQRRRADDAEREFGTPVANVFFKVDRNQGSAMPLGNYAKAWSAACKRAGVTNKRVHDTRRGAVRELERAGVSRSVAMSLTGHKTESVYRRYAVTDLQSQREGVEKLARLAQIPEMTGRALTTVISKK